jgi:chorismate mutase
MSPKNKKKLDIIRKKLDQIDNQLLAIIKKRTFLVNEVVKLKENKSEIVDQKRISSILKNIKAKSIKNNIDPKITNRIWKNMIWSYINYERRNFKKNNYLLCGGSFFSTKTSCFLVTGLYFFAFNLTLAFSPPAGFFT